MRDKIGPWQLMVVAGYLGWCLWLTHFPLQITSDDALNFSRAIPRFSVLEFRPHFPGYPAFVGWCHLVALFVNSDIANVWASLLAAMALPLLLMRLIYVLSYSWLATILGGLLLLMQPLLVSLALDGLADSSAIAVFMLALISAIKQQNYRLGLWLGLMLAMRPSYLPLVIGFALFPLMVPSGQKKLRFYWQVGSGILIIGIISLLFIMQHDGLTYFSEGLRFIKGHFGIWGNIAPSDNTRVWRWFNSLQQGFGLPNLLLVAIAFIGALIRGFFIGNLLLSHEWRNIAVIAIIGIIYWVWITLGQNPDNLRHWAPVLILFCTMFPLLVIDYESGQKFAYSLSIILVIAGLISFAITSYRGVDFSQRLAPITQAIYWLKSNPKAKVIGSNYSVNLLRQRLGERAIYDMYYPSSHLALQRLALGEPNNVWRLSATRLDGYKLVKQFSARFIGERDLFLYQIGQ